MGLTTFEGSVVRKKDIEVAKNYLDEDEIKELNRLVNMFLDFAEDRANRRKEITLAQWIDQTEKILEFNERDLLKGAGKKSRKEMLSYTEEQYQIFEDNRKSLDKDESEKEYLNELEETLKAIEKKTEKKS